MDTYGKDSFARGISNSRTDYTDMNFISGIYLIVPQIGHFTPVSFFLSYPEFCSP